ncbi:class I glutamine amidotransferase-like protein [Rhexocercosporidium sp. MPI-PUGE-AT-0058]|nr:class I glutamine amidotransferase-like protein [Rhexocercosporidium sp. MPI-PUGE-AT-0058]
MAPTHLHLAVLDCDTPVPTVLPKLGLYSNIFESLLRDAAANKTRRLTDLKLDFSSYDSVLGELPTSDELHLIDGLIITGSAASAYDAEPWIKSLTEFVKNIYISHPHIKLFGSCFGHQLICNALFSTPLKPVVSRDPKGYELGVHPVTLTTAFLTRFGLVISNTSNPKELRLQFVHADHVVVPTLPEGFHSIGRSKHCALQGVWKEGQVLTYQGHAEFDRFINGETIKAFRRPEWSDEYVADALKAVDADDDATWAAGVMLRFFFEQMESRKMESRVSY